MIVGSSNFTPSGLTHNTELNSVSLESEALYVRSHWFDKFWNEAMDFKAGLIELLDASRFGSKEYTPYDVYIKALFELQKEDIEATYKEVEQRETDDPALGELMPDKPLSSYDLRFTVFQLQERHRPLYTTIRRPFPGQ